MISMYHGRKIEVFVLRAPRGNDEEWRATVDGKLLPAVWNSKGAALGGAEVEIRREEQRSFDRAAKGIIK